MTRLEREHTDIIKEWILAYRNMLDAGYSYQDISDFERKIDTGNFIEIKNDVEKRLYNAYLAEKESIHKLTSMGYEMEETTEFYLIANKEVKEGI